MAEVFPKFMRDSRLADKAHGHMPQRFRRSKAWTRETPTTSIYFSEVMADFISDSVAGNSPIIRLEPNVFTTRGPRPVTLVMRYASPAMLKRLQTTSGGRVLYVIDDETTAIDKNRHLPGDYRRRMADFRAQTVLPMLEVANEVLSPSQVILDECPVAARTLISPSMVHSAGDIDHHDNGSKRFDIVFGGARSHVDDLGMIAPELARMLSANPHFSLTTFLGKHAPAVLSGSNVRHIEPLKWPDYRNFVRQNRFHLAILPARDTLFNRARSQSRIIDNAAFGAAAMYSDRAPFSNWVEHGNNAFLVGDSPADWRESILRLSKERPLTRSIAAGGIKLAKKIGDKQQIRQFWLAKLGIADISAVATEQAQRA